MSETIGFIGVGNIGLPMADQLLKAAHTVRVFDIIPSALQQAVDLGAISVAIDGSLPLPA